MFANTRSVVALTLVVLMAAVGPAAAAGSGSSQASSSITATVQVTDELVTLTFTQDGQAAANRAVTVTQFGEASLAASGNYTTDADGQVRFAAPEKPSTVQLGVDTKAGQAAALVRLQAPESGTWQTTVSLSTANSDDGDAAATAAVAGPALPGAVPQGLAQLQSVQASVLIASGSLPGLAVEASGAGDAGVTMDGDAATVSSNASASADSGNADSEAHADSSGNETAVTVSGSGEAGTA